MPNYTKEEIMTAYRNLPEDVKEAMFSVDTVEILREIGEKHKLMIDKVGELANETGLVMLGLTHPNQFINNLAERLEVEHDIAKEIAEEINSKVFFPIRENLKKIHGLAPTLEEVGPPAGEAGISTPPISTPLTPPAPAITPEPTPAKEPEPIKETPEEAKPEPQITTPPVIMSMPIDLTKAQKTQAEGETLPPPVTPEPKTGEEVFQPPTETKEKIEIETQAVKKVDPYREQLS
jgi:hypothetical protein